MESHKPHIRCRVCDSTELIEYLNLGNIPLSNNLNNTSEEALECERFPLSINLCKNCGLSQLSIVVNPNKLFANYFYRSSINKGYVKHCREMAKSLKKEYQLDQDSFHIDIASNDGSLLKEFKEEIGHKILGVDPAKNLARIAQEGGIPTLDDFWTIETAKDIVNVCGKADLISATNVFAHVDKIQEFLLACKHSIKPNGIIVIECPYFVEQFKNTDYTQTYFEHLSYITVTPIHQLCRSLNLKIIHLDTWNIHGGTIRFTIANENSLHFEDDSLGHFLDKEYDRGYNNLKIYRKWAERISVFQEKLYYEITDLLEKDYNISAFSCSAKGNILLNTVGLSNHHIDYIIDETPEKIGKFFPGTGIEIFGIDQLLKEPPDYLLLLSYNFKDEIIEKVKKLGYKGKFICPIPNFEIID
jgi:SAM-dependent methyltransferase